VWPRISQAKKARRQRPSRRRGRGIVEATLLRLEGLGSLLLDLALALPRALDARPNRKGKGQRPGFARPASARRPWEGEREARESSDGRRAADGRPGPLFSLGQKTLERFSKLAVLTLALIAIGTVVLSWDRISSWLNFSAEISHASLTDPIAPLSLRYGETALSQGRLGGYDADALDGHFGLTETFAWTHYTVAPGDTVSGIAARHSISQESIIALNDIKETWNLQAGRTLRIPNMNGVPYTVAGGDTLERIALSTGAPLNVLLDANDIRDSNIAPGQTLFIPGGRMNQADLSRAIWRAPDRPFIRPVPGRITSGFGWREDPLRPGSGAMQLHRAVDLAGRVGDPVRASMAGTVAHRGATPTMGNFLILQHGEYQTLYAHLSAFSVSVGQTVRQGQQIGLVGDTGRTTGPHLHFAVFHNGEPVNPVDRWR